MKDFYWQGEYINAAEVDKRIVNLNQYIEQTFTTSLKAIEVIEACDRFSKNIFSKGISFQRLLNYVLTDLQLQAKEAAEFIQEISQELTRDKLQIKLQRELGSLHSQTMNRVDFRDSVFEAWSPLGVLVHVTPSNAASVAPLSIIEGLLSGNMNIAKLSSSDSCFTQMILDEICSYDVSGRIAKHIIVLKFASNKKEWLSELYAAADGIAVWGSEEAVRGVKAVAPEQTKIIAWGHKISFAYISKNFMSCEQTIKQLVKEIFIYNQQACSSPQVVYLEEENHEKIKIFAHALAKMMEVTEKEYPDLEISTQEQAEITNVVQVAKIEQALDLSYIIQARDKQWHVLVDYNSALKASPLNRNIWLKPLPKNKIISTLRPMRTYLQTVGLACTTAELETFADPLYKAGVLRICKIGSMTESYAGEPHDGIYALQSYSKKVSLNLKDRLDGICSFEELRLREKESSQSQPIMHKEQFQSQTIDEKYSDLFFKSGGSSGKAKLSIFTYNDYHTQMKLAAQGLYAAGLDPQTDKCMNLFFAGDLYGGFVSFFTILEFLRAVQFPMAASIDYETVANTILEHEVSVLLGMPTYIFHLLQSQRHKLLGHHKIKKIFYGGEHFNAGQLQILKEDFGIQVIKSATYGSVDAGPLGFQCRHCEGSIHHLHTGLQMMEIVKLDEDIPVEKGEVGRLLFTSLNRQGQSLNRYEIGDLGRWIEGECPCGRKNPRFDLVGRHGDIFRIGTNFFNYKKFIKILEENFQYQDQVQIVLSQNAKMEQINLYISEKLDISLDVIYQEIIRQYKEIKEAVEYDMLTFKIEKIASEKFQKTPSSGKLIHVIDQRKKS